MTFFLYFILASSIGTLRKYRICSLYVSRFAFSSTIIIFLTFVFGALIFIPFSYVLSHGYTGPTYWRRNRTANYNLALLSKVYILLDYQTLVSIRQQATYFLSTTGIESKHVLGLILLKTLKTTLRTLLVNKNCKYIVYKWTLIHNKWYRNSGCWIFHYEKKWRF